MTFSYSAIWDDTVRLLKAHASLVIAVAGAFLMLPQLLTAYFYPRPQAKTYEEAVPLVVAYFSDHWPVLLLASLISAIGAITILLLLFDRGQLTVGGAIRAAVPLLIPYFIAGFLANLAVAVGLILFLAPGLYLLGRFAPVGPAVAAERLRNPLDALKRGFELTRGRGWQVLGLLVIVFVTGWIMTFAISRVVGSLFLLLAGQRLGGLLVLILEAGLEAALTAVVLVLYAAIYRRLAAEPQPRSMGI